MILYDQESKVMSLEEAITHCIFLGVLKRRQQKLWFDILAPFEFAPPPFPCKLHFLAKSNHLQKKTFKLLKFHRQQKSSRRHKTADSRQKYFGIFCMDYFFGKFFAVILTESAPPGQFSHRVAMSVRGCLCAMGGHFFRPFFCSQVTWSVPGLSLVLPHPPLLPPILCYPLQFFLIFFWNTRPQQILRTPSKKKLYDRNNSKKIRPTPQIFFRPLPQNFFLIANKKIN